MLTKRKIIVGLLRLWRCRWHRNAMMMAQSLIIGVATAFAVYFLHFLVVKISRFCGSLGENLSDGKYVLYVLLPLPFVGILLSFIFQKIFTGKSFSKSLSGLILNLDRRKSNIPIKETFSHIFSSALSVGFGGSAGLEAPSVLTGAAIASNITRPFKLHTMPRSILIGCGASAAIAGIFDSPIAGVLFVVESLLPEHSVSALVPIVLSSATSSVVSRLLTGHDAFFATSLTQWNGGEILPIFLLGIVCALVAVCIIRGTAFTAGLLNKYFPNQYMRLLWGGIILACILALFPLLRGQGYRYIEGLLQNRASVVFDTPYLLSFMSPELVPYVLVLAAIFIKIVASSLTVASGGDGGIFAPTVFIGAFTGYAFAHAVNMLGFVNVSSPNFTALGMCGVFTAVMRTPLAGVFLIAETTCGFTLLVPLMIVAAISWYIGRLFEPHSIYRKSLIAQHLIAEDSDIAFLKRLKVEQCVISMPITLRAGDTLADAEVLIRRGRHNSIDVYPVLNDAGRLIGMVTPDKLLTVLVRASDSSAFFVSDVMELPDGMMHSLESLDSALAKMQVWHLHYLPVSSAKTGMFLGMISKESIFDRYRTMNSEQQL